MEFLIHDTEGLSIILDEILSYHTMLYLHTLKLSTIERKHIVQVFEIPIYLPFKLIPPMVMYVEFRR